MTAALATLLLAAACLGGGAAALRVLGLSADLDRAERWASAFALGYGLVGWAIFPLGLAGGFHAVPILVLLAAFSAGMVFLRDAGPGPAAPPLSPGERVLAAGLAVAAALGLAVVLVPPADADSLAYHFALPKLFLAAGHPVFQARGLDGAVPLLNQMTYLAALGLGGERAMTLWTWLSAWGAVAAIGVAARPALGRQGALLLCLLLATTPAWLYGAYSGQIEVRMAMFMAAAVWLAVRALGESRRLGWAAAAGLAAGFCIASKYTGLIFTASIGLVVLSRRGWLRRALAFGAVAALAGCPWYLWNWANTGDPLYPMLWGKVPYKPGLWDDVTHARFLSGMAAELAVPASLRWWLSYPVVATLGGPAEFQSTRTGLGPLGLLLAPFALAGAWRARARLAGSPLAAAAMVALVAYSLWFFIPSSQRLRHLLPLYPLVLAPLLAAVAADGWRRPARVAVAATLALQMAAAGLFAWQPLRHLASGESREAWLRRNVADYQVAEWANAHLGPGERLFNTTRTINYYLDVPYFYAHNWLQSQVDLDLGATEPRFFAQLQALGITHAAVPDTGSTDDMAERLTLALVAHGCAAAEAQLESRVPRSRTIQTMGADTQRWVVARLTAQSPRCDLKP
ncbi:MAG: glycosyltransferase family 39 protein [Actinomycetota bacterium]